MEDYLTEDFNDSYPFPRRSFVFYIRPLEYKKPLSFRNINTALYYTIIYLISQSRPTLVVKTENAILESVDTNRDVLHDCCR